MSYNPRPTIHGIPFFTAASALQKFIRRGMEREALFIAADLDASGYGEYAWKRLRIICSEDVGLAWLEGPSVIRALYDNWTQFKATDRKSSGGATGVNQRLFLMHAVLLLVRAEKSRIVDNAVLATYREPDPPPIPEWVFDMHTARGRSKGRGVDHFFDEASQLANSAELEDPYRDRARELLLAEQAGRLKPPSARSAPPDNRLQRPANQVSMLDGDWSDDDEVEVNKP